MMQGLRPEQLVAGEKYEWRYIAGGSGTLCYSTGTFLRSECDNHSVPGESILWLWFRHWEDNGSPYDACIDWNEQMIIKPGVE